MSLAFSYVYLSVCVGQVGDVVVNGLASMW